jgi:4-amino-4-deoxy-L-arabinose transferase-like glycosyltransferase
VESESGQAAQERPGGRSALATGPRSVWDRLSLSRYMTAEGSRWGVVVLVIAILIAVVDLVWLSRYRSGGPLDIDESGYLGIAAADASAFHYHGPLSLVTEFVNQHYEAPFVPLAAGILELLVSRTTAVGFAVLACASVVVVLATYGVARRFVSPAWSAVAAVVTGCIPEMLAYSRFFEFAVPITAVMMLAVWALLRSEGLSRRGWSIALGVFVGLLTLTRTMTIAFVPGFFAAAVLQVAVHRRPGARANLVVASVAAALTALVWYGRNVRYVAHYLLHFGYGAEASNFGASHSLISWGYWSREAGVMLGGAAVPISAMIAIGLICGAVLIVAAFREREHGYVRAALGSELAVLVVIVAEGYLFLSSTQNVGTGFELPLIPIVVVLAVVGVARLVGRLAVGGRAGGRVLTVTFAAGAIAGASLSLLSSSDAIPSLASPTTVRVPGFGVQPVIENTNLLVSELQSVGYPLGGLTDRLPAPLLTWQRRMRGLAVTLVADADREHASTPLIAAPPNLLYSANGFVWAARQAANRRLLAADILLPKGATSESAYRAVLKQFHANFVVIPQSPLYRSDVSQLPALVAATRAAGYVVAQRIAEPDAVITIYREPGQAR